jgi:glycosyltransferase involved in cell wall biosynthesis
MGNTFFIHAANIHQGGGERLLNAVLAALPPEYRVVLTVDQRMPMLGMLPLSVEVKQIKNSVFARLFVELWLFVKATKDDCVLCFGNLPPLLQLRAFTSIFVQNRYIVDTVGLNGLKIWTRLRIFFERSWFRWGVRHADQYIVQTSSMQSLVGKLVKGYAPVVVAPFMSPVAGARKTEATSDVGNPSRLPAEFVYPASGEVHKNHRRLIEAWCLLAGEGIRPRLLLTIDPLVFPELCSWIQGQVYSRSLNVKNLGTIDAGSMAVVYKESDVLIYPSLVESFGLPLLEASAAGLAIIAAERDYVRDVVHPKETFDPLSAVSIARAVKRFFQHQPSKPGLLSPAEFIRLSINFANQ